MFIARSYNVAKNGERRYRFALYHSKRVDGTPKRFTVLNLGQDFAVPEEHWEDLSKLVENKLRGKPIDLSEVSELVRQTYKRIMEDLSVKAFVLDEIHEKREPIILASTELQNLRSIGGERLAIQVLEELGFPQLLLRQGLSERQIQVAMVLVVGRMLSPGSERHTYEWMWHESGIMELLGLSDDEPGESSLYRTGDVLYDCREALIGGMFRKARGIIGFEPKVVFYDLTNMYYTGKRRGFLLRHGRSKEKRTDLPLVTLALTIDASGFPRCAKIYPGNIAEPKTLIEVITSMGVKRGTTIVLDAGIATEANLGYLSGKGLRWVTVDRSKPKALPKGQADQILALSEATRLHLWDVSADSIQKKIYVHSEARKKVEDELMRVKREAYEAALVKLDTGLSQPGRLKDYGKVCEAVGRLKERHKKVSYHYEVKVARRKDNSHASEVSYTEKDVHKKRTDTSGGYYIKTNRDDLSLEGIVRQYHSLNDIEQTFRAFKSDLRLRPIYHRKDCRIEAHIFITVLSYFAVHLIRTRLKEGGIDASWKTLQKELRRWQRGDVLLKKSRTEKIRLSMDVKPRGLHAEVGKIMGLPSNRYLTRETIMTKQAV